MNAQSANRYLMTRSPLKAWFLQTFCGQRVYWRSCKPYTCVLGLVLYETRWFLVSADSTANLIPILN